MKLQSKANRRARDKAGGNTTLLVQKNWKGRRRGNGRGGGTCRGNDGQTYAPFPSKCERWYCQKVGHLAADCPQRLEDEKKKGTR
jgi:hypothetical protein